MLNIISGPLPTGRAPIDRSVFDIFDQGKKKMPIPMRSIDTLYQYRQVEYLRLCFGILRAPVEIQKRRGIFVTLLLCAFLVSACNSTGEEAKGQSVVATIYPLQYFASQIGGSQVQVTGLVPTA